MAETLPVIACPHPFRTERVRYDFPAGLTVRQILLAVQPRPELLRTARVFLGGEPVPEAAWDRVRPKAGHELTVRMVPAGGGGKNPLAVVMSIALFAAAPYLGVQLSGALNLGLAMGTAGVGLATAAITIAGQLAIQALAPPPGMDLDDLSGAGDRSPTYAISGGRNRMAQYAAIPQVLGRHKIVPPYGAPPYTELQGQDQYMRFLFLLGYGPLRIEDLRIGETDLYDYDAVEVEIREGYADDEPLTLFPGQVAEESVGTVLSAAAGWQSRTTEPETEEIAVELVFAQGLGELSNSGERWGRTVELEVGYAPAGGGIQQLTEMSPTRFCPARSVTLPRPPGYDFRGEDRDPGDALSRIDLVTIAEATGEPQVRPGQATTGAPATPAVPDGHLAVCSVPSSGDSYGALTDLRDPVLTASGAGSFAPTLDVTTGWAVGASVDIAAGDYVTARTVITARKLAPLRYGVSARVPSGQYDVFCRRTTADSSDDQVFDECTWAVLRSIKHEDPVQIDGMARIALRIRATDQLNGVIDQFSAVATTVCPDWDGAAWTPAPTANPAALARHVLQGPANKRPIADSRLDLPALQELADAALTNGWRFNAVLERGTTTARLLGDILSVARASRGLRDGLYTVVRDRVQTVHYGHLTPRNSWDARGEKAFTDPPHGLKIRFVNLDQAWRQDERIVLDDGYAWDYGDGAGPVDTFGDPAPGLPLAERFETLDLFGTTDPDQAWRHGRYYLGVMRLRPEVHSRSVDFEHLTFTRGDMIRVTDDVALHGIAGARVKSLVLDEDDQSPSYGKALQVVLDERVPMEAGQTYALRFRRSDGSGLYRAVATAPGETDTLSFSVPLDPADFVAPDDLASFGETDRETAAKLVTRIEMLPDLAARVFYVDLANAVHDADTQAVPAYDPQITVPADLTATAPAVPEILGVISDERALVKRDDGTLLPRIVVGLAAGPGAAWAKHIECQYREQGQTTPWTALPPLPPEAGEVVMEAVETGRTYDIRLRAVSPYGVASSWTTVSETVVGKTGLPTDVTGLSNRTVGDALHLSWDAHPHTDVRAGGKFVIRYNWKFDATMDWSEGVFLAEVAGSATEVTLPFASGTYLVKVVDSSGNVSAGYAAVAVPDSIYQNHFEFDAVEEDPAFAGAKTNTEVSGGVLQLTAPGGVVSSSGEYEFDGRVELLYPADVGADFLNWWVVFRHELEVYSANEDTRATLYIKVWRHNDLAGTAEEGQWEKFRPGGYEGAEFDFKVVLESDDPAHNIEVRRLRVAAMLEQRSYSTEATTLTALNTTVYLGAKDGRRLWFIAQPSVSVTIKNQQPGDYLEIVSVSVGAVTFNVWNSGSRGARDVSISATGHGAGITSQRAPVA